ncbi:MAG: DMT family transporter [Nitratireductor sp.]|uniref:DMT family transporter n=1 Tax=Bauldia litoralis TaxID=665467 RepID=UPI00326635D3
MAAPELPTQQVMRGIVLMIVAASLFACVDGFSKLLAETQSVGQIVWARYTMAVPVLFATTAPSHWRSLFRTSRPLAQLGRAFIPLGTSVTMVLSVRYLPLAEATVILFTAPFIVVLLSALVLKERVPMITWMAVIVGFAAVILVARPGFGTMSGYMVFPLIGALFFAAFQLVTRWLRAGGETAHTTLAWTLAVGAVISAPFAFLTWVPVSAEAWLLMAGLGIVFGLAQALMVRAYAHASAGVLTPFSYAQLVAAAIIGMVVFAAVPDVWTVVGIIMITIAGITVARARRS